MQNLDVMAPVGASASVLFQSNEGKYFLYEFSLENQADGDVDIQPLDSADGITWGRVQVATTMVPGGMITLSLQTDKPYFMVAVGRATGSTAVGLVKGTLALPVWVASQAQIGRNDPINTACITACQDDCQSACMAACESGCESVCEISAQT